jgi:NAD(P)-dependent dehydrogenase (short-subunit alcohol dehydrogenase family)
MGVLDGKTAMVTGARSGVGRGIALALAVKSRGRRRPLAAYVLSRLAERPEGSENSPMRLPRTP